MWEQSRRSSSSRRRPDPHQRLPQASRAGSRRPAPLAAPPPVRPHRRAAAGPPCLAPPFPCPCFLLLLPRFSLSQLRSLSHRYQTAPNYHGHGARRSPPPDPSIRARFVCLRTGSIPVHLLPAASSSSAALDRSTAPPAPPDLAGPDVQVLLSPRSALASRLLHLRHSTPSRRTHPKLSPLPSSINAHERSKGGLPYLSTRPRRPPSPPRL